MVFFGKVLCRDDFEWFFLDLPLARLAAVVAVVHSVMDVATQLDTVVRSVVTVVATDLKKFSQEFG